MIWKYICVLANSEKLGARCVAGIELRKSADGRFEYAGRWIRPVSSRGGAGGAVNTSERKYADGAEPQPLDIAEVPLLKHAGDEMQPENWVLDPRQKWKRIRNVGVDKLENVEDTPDDLWLDPGEKVRRISPAFLRSIKERRSLYLIRPESIQLEVYPDFNPFHERDVTKRDAVFVYKGTKYRLPMHDPRMREKYCPHDKSGVDKKNVIPLENGGGYFLCISYTSEFRGYHSMSESKGYHYKIAATILELSA
jgi:hypothetical protein